MSKIKCLILGNKGSGKTTLLNYFSNLGYRVFNADNFIHQYLYKKNQKGYLYISDTFGLEYVNELEVDRVKLKQYLYTHPSYLQDITHFVNKYINTEIESKQDNILFIELPTYFDYQNDFSFEINVLIFLKKKNETETLFQLNKFDKIYSLIEKYFNNHDIACFYKNNQEWKYITLNDLVFSLNNKEK